jgi:flagellar M-ring protein FliF
MNLLNTTYAQLRDLLGSMTIGARITAALLLSVVVISLTFLFQHGAAGPDEYLFGGESLPASQLDDVEAAIAKAGLSGHLRDGRGIRVPASRKSEFMAAVADQGALPPNLHTLLEKALDNGSPLDSRETTRNRLKIATQRTLSEWIGAMDWVDEASVLYDEEQLPGPNRQKQVTATVGVKPILGEVVDPRRERNLQRLVAGSIAGLSPENVVVTSLGGDAYTEGGAGYADAFDDEYYQTRVLYEQYKRDSIRNTLNFIRGVRVEVNAILTDIASEKIRGVKPDEKTALIEEVTSSDNSTETVTTGGGPPGLESQGPTPRESELANKTVNQQKQIEENQAKSFAGFEDTVTVKKGLIPKEVWATVAVPASYLVDVWREQNQVPEGDARQPSAQDLTFTESKVKEKIENLVEPHLDGHVKGEDNYKYVIVEFFDTAAPANLPEPSLASTAADWTGRNWSMLSMMGLAVFSLLVLRSIVRSGPPHGSPTMALSVEHEGSAAAAAGGGDDENDEQRPRLRLKKSALFKDDLADIVREDPDAAAAILRSWIGNAA